MTFLYYSLLLLFLVLCVFLVLLVLIQKGRGGGLSAAFGGVGGNTAFGAKTGDVLTWATSIVFGIFLLLAIGLNLIANHEDEKNRKVLIDTPATQPASAVPADSSTPGPILTPTTKPVTAAPPVDPARVPPPATEPANSAAQQVAKEIVDKVAPATQPGR